MFGRIVRFADALPLVLAISAGPANALRDLTRTASPFYVAYVVIPTGFIGLFETQGCSSGANPALHLLRQNGTSWTQVASDDYPGLGVNARISHTNSNSSQLFMLVMVAATSSGSGTCVVRRDNATFESSAPVGGDRIPQSLMSHYTGDDLRSVHVPGGSVMPALITFTGGVTTISAVAIANAPGGSAKLTLAGNESHYLIGTPNIRDTVGTIKRPRSGNARLIANDVGLDTDGDGLGNNLEVDLQTCSQTTGCGFNAPHGRDSDRDGLLDGDEVFGVAGQLSNGADDLPFARWGANPRRKDVFVEIDHIRQLENPVGTNLNPFQWIRDNPDVDGAFYDGTVEKWVLRNQAPYIPTPTNTHLKNRDSSNGVRIHLDIGIAPITPADEALFGDYGASSARAVEKDWQVVVKNTTTGAITVTINGVQRPAFSASGMTKLMIAGRIGYEATSTNQNVAVRSIVEDTVSGDVTLLVQSTVGGQAFSPAIVAPGGTVSWTRETLPWNRYNTDDFQFAANRRGRFRYAVVTTIWHAGQTGGVAFTTGMDMQEADVTPKQVPSFTHELGHTLDLQHWGHGDWGNTGSQPNSRTDCIPHYPSIMGYSDYFLEFSAVDSPGGLPLNPAAVVETQTFGAAYSYASLADPPWKYLVSGSNVDWNRTRAIETGSTAWRTPALSLLDKSCQAFSQGRVPITPLPTTVSGAVDLAKIGSRLYAFWPEGNAIKYRFADVGTGAKSCVNSDLNGPCLSWDATTYALGNAASANAVTVAYFGTTLYTVFRSTGDTLVAMRHSVNANGTLQSLAAEVNLDIPADPASRSQHPPELTELYDQVTAGQVAVLYLGTNSKFQMRRLTGTTWGAPTPLLPEPSGTDIAGSFAPAAKTWYNASGNWASNEKRTLAVLPSTQPAANVDLYLLLSNGKWQKLVTSPLRTSAKPFLEFRQLRTSSGTLDTNYQGHFIVGSSVSDGSKTRAMIRYSELVSRAAPPSTTSPNGFELLEVGSFLGNQWATEATGSTAVLYSDSSLDNVFGLDPLDVPGQVALYFLPHADGAPNRDYKVYSDFKVMEDGICRLLSLTSNIDCGTYNVLD